MGIIRQIKYLTRIATSIKDNYDIKNIRILSDQEAR